MAAIRSGNKRGCGLRNDAVSLRVTTFLRIGLGVLFIVASYYKILSPGAFAHQIYNYKIVPPWAINPVAITLPWLQMFCGLALVFRRFDRGAAWIVVLMLVVFQIAVASALIRGLNISCGCFKSGGGAATWWGFARDSFILIAAVVNALWNSTIARKT